MTLVYTQAETHYNSNPRKRVELSLHVRVGMRSGAQWHVQGEPGKVPTDLEIQEVMGSLRGILIKTRVFDRQIVAMLVNPYFTRCVFVQFRMVKLP